MNPSQLVKFRLKKDFNAQTEKWSGIRASAGGYVRQRRMLCYTILVGPISRSPIGDKNDSVARFFNFEKPEGPRRPH